MSTQPPTLTSQQRRKLRQIAHHLHPVVTIGDRGVSDGILAETERALEDHELIKVRIHGEDRTARTAAIDELITGVGAVEVQRIGKIAVLYRENPERNDKLSNVVRYG